MPVELRPRRIRLVCWVVAPVIVVLFTAMSFGLRGSTGDGFGQFRAGDQGAMIGLGVLTAGGILLLARPRVRADAERVRVRNVLGGYDLPWSVVRGVRFDRHSPCAVLDLHDDETVSVQALQAVDKEHAVAGVQALRRLHAAATGVPTS
jgi:hypothetical protein